MDFQGVVSLLGLLVGAIGAYYARQQVMLIRRAQLSSSDNMQSTPSVTSENPRFLRLKLYGPIVTLVVLVLLAWVPHFMNQQFPKWPDPYRPILVINKTFTNTEVLLDGYSYDHCTFENVTFVYNGTTPPNNIFPTMRGSFTFRSDNLAIEGTALLFKGLGFLKTDVNMIIHNPSVIVREPGDPVE